MHLSNQVYTDGQSDRLRHFTMSVQRILSGSLKVTVPLAKDSLLSWKLRLYHHTADSSTKLCATFYQSEKGSASVK